jgi:hypothetical protein
LIAFHLVKSLFGSVNDEVGGVISKEALAHVHNWLLRRVGGPFVDDCPSLLVSDEQSKSPSSQVVRSTMFGEMC